MLASIHLSYVLAFLPFEERFPAARKLGFGAVEFPFPYPTPAADYARLLADNGLTQIAIGAPACDYKSAAPGFSMTPALKSVFDDSIGTAIAYAKAIDCRHVHAFAGALAPDVSRDLAFDTYCRNLAEAYDRLAAEGIRLIVEPINSTDFPGYFIDRLDLAMTAIAQAERPGIGIVLDVYHAAVNGEDPIAFLREHRDHVAHIQLADCPGRNEPGTGTTDFEAIFRAIDEVGYTGSIGLEYVPTASVFDRVPLASLLGVADRMP